MNGTNFLGTDRNSLSRQRLGGGSKLANTCCAALRAARVWRKPNAAVGIPKKPAQPLHAFPERPHTAQGTRKRTVGQPPRVREATVEDYEQIAALHGRNGFGTKSYDDWTSLWRGNPAYEQWGGQWPIGWVLETENRNIEGWVGNVPSAYQFQGRRLYAATPESWLVDVRQRGYGIFILKRLLRQKDVHLFVTSNASAVSDAVSPCLGFSRVPVGAWDKSAFWITNYPGLAKIVLKMKSVPLAAAIAYPVSAALLCWNRCNDGWTNAGWTRRRSPITEIERCWEFDSRFDDFWEELQRQNENVLLAVRSRETLTWHFRSSLMQKSLWILAAQEGSRLTAYAIFDRQDTPAIGLQRVRLVDFQALKGAESALQSALSWMLHKCREDGIHMLEISGCWLSRPGLPRIVAPFHRTMPSWRYHYKATDPKLSAMLTNPRVWFPSCFDGDASL